MLGRTTCFLDSGDSNTKSTWFGHHLPLLNTSTSPLFFCLHLLQTISITSSKKLRTIPTERTIKKKTVSKRFREDPFARFPQLPALSLTPPYRLIMESWIPASFIFKIVRSIRSLNSRSFLNGNPHWLLKYLQSKNLRLSIIYWFYLHFWYRIYQAPLEFFPATHDPLEIKHSNIGIICYHRSSIISRWPEAFKIIFHWLPSLLKWALRSKPEIILLDKFHYNYNFIITL